MLGLDRNGVPFNKTCLFFGKPKQRCVIGEKMGETDICKNALCEELFVSSGKFSGFQSGERHLQLAAEG